MDNHIQFTQDGKLLMSTDILSKNPWTYVDNLPSRFELTAKKINTRSHKAIFSDEL